MTENEFDEFFRRKLHDFESHVPEDSWSKIQRRVDDDRRRPFLWWTLAAVLFIGIATGGYFMQQQHGQRNGQLAGKHQSTQEKDQTKTNANDLNSTQTDSLVSTDTNNNNSSENKAAEENTASDKRAGIAAVNAPAGKTKLQANDKSTIAKSYGRDNPALIKDAEAHTQVPGNAEKAKSIDEKNELNASDVTAKTSNDQTVLGVDTAAGNAVVANKAVPSTQKQTTETAVTKKKEKQSTSTSKDRFIEVYASPAYSWQKTDAKAGYENYVSEKNAAEKSSISFNAGFRLTQKLNDHFFIKSGLQYTQVNQKFTYNTPNVYRDVPVTVQRYITTDAGAVNSFVSVSMARMIGYSTVTVNNHYSSLELPVLVGYETNGDKFKAAFSAGVIFNLHSWYNGSIVDTFYNASSIKDFDPYKNNMGLSLYFGVGLSRKLSERASLFAEPYLQYRLGNMTKSSAPFTQKINVGGLSLGLKYKF
ncbi:outer membrane beta-barrel protein [Danxiaibacter flavus]|uniref:Outer membrane beta-barrel protein n=1 Tax=Danxiaibacter flavus TaxID=3049108 RepID=A0ABV3Z9X1_9BACT|nr:outer membrane beta-barrel protein [Chitinophagaceae bacterium DXS]